MSNQINHFYEFGPFRVDVVERLLLRGGETIPLTPKVFEMLLALLENSGHVLEKAELLQRVWPDSFVEEANLSHNIYKLREALGDGRDGDKYIETVPRRGYRFVAEVRESNGTVLLAETTRTHIVIEEDLDVPETAVNTDGPARLAAGAFTGHRREMILAVGILMVAVIGLVILARYRGWGPFADRTAPFTRIKLTRVTTSGVGGQTAISPDGKYVVMVSGAPREQSIRLRHVETGSETEIAPSAGVSYCCPFFSRDGNYVYFAKTLSNTPSILYQVRILGGATRTIAEDLDSRPALSPDGKRFAFMRGYPAENVAWLILANVDGSGEQKLARYDLTNFFPRTRFNSSRNNTFYPAWSPDGRLIVLRIQASDAAGYFWRILTVRVKDGGETQFTSTRWSALGQFEWFPDGSGLLFTGSDEPAGFPQQVWYASFPGGQVRKITNDLSNYQGISLTADASAFVTRQLDWPSSIWIAPQGVSARASQITTNKYDGFEGLEFVPDGRIVYTSRSTGNPQLWIVNGDGTGRNQLTVDDFGGHDPAISPDGRFVVFVSDRPGSSNLWRLDLDGTHPTQIATPNSAEYPVFAADSQWIIYTSKDSGPQKLWRVPINGGNSQQITEHNFAGAAVSPDGKWLACGYFDEAPKRWVAVILSAEGGPIVKRFEVPAFPLRLRWTPNGKAFSYVLTQGGVSNIWRQPIDGGPAVQLTDFRTDQIYWFDWSREGNLALARGAMTSDVVLVSDVK